LLLNKIEKRPPINQLDVEQAKWFAVHTRSKCEKMVVDLLARKSIEAYVPIREQLRMYGTRKRKTLLPVITCYAFVRIKLADYLSVLETEHVFSFVRTSQNLMAIPDSEINQLKRIAMDTALDWVAVPDQFVEGQDVTVTAGNLAGMKGKLVKIAGKDTFVVALETIGQSLLITMDVKYLA
jgi:transcriptional antiterminator RfaH